ncbi:hypothetical protein FVE85_6871 [Porphyridium purpureum]|uniref:Uncharacterized protein n=1 Tax=Porphyridium purpureum TaxID=35688 RepID=A0A5J4Z6H6_PORPP|nr:hypothetical protein FVE85_6871 [Porphyridium purpureum]|eukprot:POR8012..scf295_1
MMQEGICFLTPASYLVRDKARSSSRCARLSLRLASALGSDDAELARRRLQDAVLDGVLRPPPVRQFRAPLDLAFAVLLARSTYNAMDELDFMPTDRFQREFFLLRADEYEKYIKHTRVARQGDLTDPAYFDFISYAAFRTVSQEMFGRPQKVFEEQFDAQGSKRLVLRDPNISDASLPSRFRQLVGDKVLLGVREQMQLPQFEGTQGPSPSALNSSSPSADLVGGILQTMKSKGFALVIDSEVSIGKVETAGSRNGPASMSVAWELAAPATLWGEAYLRRRRALVNDFDAMMIEAMFRQCGWRLAEGSYQNTRVAAGWKRAQRFVRDESKT